MKPISWPHFATSNCDIAGLRIKFESLCRQLFVREYLSDNELQRIVHCNPNNPGLETEPVYDEKNKRWIGFQSKFFDNGISYPKIRESAEQIVKHYNGKVDYVFLFCNKDINVNCKSYSEIKKLLAKASIIIEPITNMTILDLVRKYPDLGKYYFEQNFLTLEWFDNHMKEMQQKLGERFNVNFNVDTNASSQISFFLQDKQAVQLINNKKHELFDKIGELGGEYDCYNKYRYKFQDEIAAIDDIKRKNILDALKWETILETNTEDVCKEIKKEIDSLTKKLDEVYDETYKKKEKDLEDGKKELLNLKGKIESLNKFLNIPRKLHFSDLEKNLFSKKILFVEGKAGVGKSHLFATKISQFLDENRFALLLLGGDYLDNSIIQKQIVENLRIDFSFDELIEFLDTYGSEHDCIVPVMIDALNETWKHEVWKNGLPAIVQKIKNTKYVRLAVSFRSEYERAIVGDLCDEDICRVIHNGFNDNSLTAIREFLNYYGIPFSPIHLFNSQMDNPLFLTLYCKTYQGNEADLSTLYDRLLSKTNDNFHLSLSKYLEAQGYFSSDDVVTPIVNSIAEYILETEKKTFPRSQIEELPVWKKYTLNPRTMIQQLIRENILNTYPYEEEDMMFFSYDQMNDYFCAKAIIKKYKNEQQIKDHMVKHVLSIEDGEVKKIHNIDLFVTTCALYADKFKRECIDVIETIENEIDKNEIFENYIISLQWRKGNVFSTDELLNRCRKYHTNADVVWEMFIVNSTKLSHQYNANTLHDILMEYPLCKRDQVWTTYINGLETDFNNRLVQLVKLYDSGEHICFANDNQVILLLILFGWCLTSSDRGLRDVTSKAMIEIIKEKFNLCEILLRKFEGVNDPYVMERLYGVVFGAARKRKSEYKDEFKSLAVYVYDTIFNCEKVYPHILLRDYARLLIERFVYEFPTEVTYFAREKFTPPYNSESIPKIENQGYLMGNYKGGTYRIIRSMCFEGMGMYGDFGRYIFQSKLSNFDVDQKEIYNYAVYFILNELGYDETLVGEYDAKIGHFDYNRHNVAKTERIGKKYQWIAMHNILARISDNYPMVNRYSSESRDLKFEGAWEPFVRDFDPTLNRHFVKYVDAPHFESIEKNITIARDEFAGIKFDNSTDEAKWIREDTEFFNLQKSDLILKDKDGEKWVALSRYADTDRKRLREDKVLNWNWLVGFFVTEEQKVTLCQSVDSTKDVLTTDLTWIPETYTVFNREYPWSPACKEINDYVWIDVEIYTGEKECIKETCKRFDHNKFEKFLKLYEQDEKIDIEQENLDGEVSIKNDVINISLIEEVVEREQKITKPIGKFLQATVELRWSTEYDASKNDTFSCYFPCAPIVETLGLTQYEQDGFLFDMTGKLAAFDTRLTDQKAGIVIRKDLLDEFLEKSGRHLVWIVSGSKEVHPQGTYINAESNWEGVYVYSGDTVKGNVYMRRAVSHGEY